MTAKLSVQLGALSLSKAVPRPLPMELYRDIFSYVSSMRDFCNLSILCRDLQPEAEFFIYRSVQSTSRSQTEYLCDIISSSAHRHMLVKELDISHDEWKGSPISATRDREYWERVARLLRGLPNLEELKIHDNMATGNTNAWVLSQCQFSLQKLDCDFAFDPAFLRFLRTQRALKRLYWTESYSDDESDKTLQDMNVADAGATPPVSELMTNSPRFALRFMPASTLTHVWISGPCGYENDGWVHYIEEFSLSARGLRSLRMNFPYGRRTLVTVLNTLAHYAPDLHSLGFVPYFDKQVGVTFVSCWRHVQR